MGKLVTPKVFLVGYTSIDLPGLMSYLAATGNDAFLDLVSDAVSKGLSAGEILCSMMAKLCYKSLTLGRNLNISHIRNIEDNIKACHDLGHASVFEHCQLNFVITDCSRVLTHELVRHRAGTAYSQTSGRYVRSDTFDFVFDPVLDPLRDEIMKALTFLEEVYCRMTDKMGLTTMKDFTLQKKITSALRRILPNGQSNEIGFSVNLRALRHLVMLRTGRHAEWEIRYVFNQIYKLTKDKFPLLYYGAREEIVDDLIEVSGLKMQPYDWRME